MSVNAILFDLDGTLVDSLPGIHYSIVVALSKFGLSAARTDLRSQIGPPIHTILQQVLGNVGPEVLEKVETAFRSSYDTEGWQKTLIYDGVEGTLLRLLNLGVRNFVITNKPKMPTKNILEIFRLSAFFNEVVSPDSKVPPFRSKSESVAYLISKHNLDIRTTLLVGDKKEDETAAEECGVPFAHAAYGYGNISAEHWGYNSVVLSTFSDLLTIIKPEKEDLR